MKLLKKIGRILILVSFSLSILLWPALIPRPEPQPTELSIIKRTAKSVYKVTSPDNPQSGGTGFQLMTTKGPMIITNSHVCDGVGANVVRVWQEEDYWDLPVLEISERTDLCLVKGLLNRPSLLLGKAADRLDKITIIGHPWLLPTVPSQGWVMGREDIEIRIPGKTKEECRGETYRWGEIKTWFGPMEACMRDLKSVVTNARISPGNSGSPVIDKVGRVVGVAFASNSFYGTSYYVPVYELYAFVKQYEVYQDLEEHQDIPQ